MNDDGEGDACAASLLSRYKPYEPEMTLQLFGSRFRQWQTNTKSGGAKDFRVPLPDQDVQPREVQNYMACTWKGSKMPLLEYLRKSTEDGRIINWLVKKYEDYVLDIAYAVYLTSGAPFMKITDFAKRAKAARRETGKDACLWTAALNLGGISPLMMAEQNIRVVSLNEFVQNYKGKGEKLVAADMMSRTNDKFNGQWLMLHVPFEHPDQFLNDEVDRLVPKEYRYLAMAVLCRHPVAVEFWTNAEAIDPEMQLEGWNPKSRLSIIDQLRAQRALVDDYLEEIIRKPERRDEDMERSSEDKGRMIRLPIQHKYATMINDGHKKIEGRLNLGIAKKVKKDKMG